MIKDWISKTNTEISQRDGGIREFDRFIQLNFILSNVIEKSNRSRTLLTNPNDTKLMTTYIPELVSQCWDDFTPDKEIFKNAARTLYLTMQYHFIAMREDGYYAGTGIKPRNRSLLIETKTVGYYNGTTSYVEIEMTKADFDSYDKINKYDDFKQVKFKDLVEGSLTIIYAVRNNFFHGTKTFSESQNKLIQLINLAMIQLIKVLHTIENWDFWDEIKSIGHTYRQILTRQIKNRAKIIWEDDSPDISYWHDQTNHSYENISFAYYFVTLERIKSVVEKCLLTNFKDVFDALENLYLATDSPIPELTLIKRKYINCKDHRNNIFHGSDDLQIEDNIGFFNRQMETIVIEAKSLVIDLVKAVS